MIGHSLRPAGDTISLSAGAVWADPASCLAPSDVEFYNSGTAALAAALQSVVADSGSRNPEVILPAYGCPSLVAATLFAGARPVLADLAVEKLCPSTAEIEKLITADTVAIVQVDLFGVPSISGALKQLVSGNEIQLIHDCAQACINTRRLERMENEWVILSFGRGKPVSLLGGGALLRRSAAKPSSDPFMGDKPKQKRPGLLRTAAIACQRLTYLAYNLAIWPPVYGLIDHLPLGLGKTRFKALPEIRPADPQMLAFLPANLRKQTSSTAVTKNRVNRDLYKILLAKMADSGWIDLSESQQLDAQEKLLRYPLLAPNAKNRKQLMADRLSHQLGLTAMYQLPLAEIEDMPIQLSSPGDYPHASEVAARLVTLPLHDGVTERDVARIGRLLANYS